MTRAGERGFTLLEAAVATALVCFAMLAASSAVLNALHASARTAARAALADDALSILADLRATTAYDAAALANAVGRSYTSNVVRGGETLAVAVSVTRASANAPVVAEVTVTDPNGTSATERQTLYVEAPSPGSVIDQPSPGPSGAAP